MHFTLYSRSYCHLCQDMHDALLTLLAGRGQVKIDVIDVDSDPALVARFDELVPVLFGNLDDPELCHYHLDPVTVLAYVDASK